MTSSPPATNKPPTKEEQRGRIAGLIAAANELLKPKPAYKFKNEKIEGAAKGFERSTKSLGLLFCISLAVGASLSFFDPGKCDYVMNYVTPAIGLSLILAFAVTWALVLVDKQMHKKETLSSVANPSTQGPKIPFKPNLKFKGDEFSETLNKSKEDFNSCEALAKEVLAANEDYKELTGKDYSEEPPIESLTNLDEIDKAIDKMFTTSLLTKEWPEKRKDALGELKETVEKLKTKTESLGPLLAEIKEAVKNHEKSGVAPQEPPNPPVGDQGPPTLPSSSLASGTHHIASETISGPGPP